MKFQMKSLLLQALQILVFLLARMKINQLICVILGITRAFLLLCYWLLAYGRIAKVKVLDLLLLKSCFR